MYRSAFVTCLLVSLFILGCQQSAEVTTSPAAPSATSTSAKPAAGEPATTKPPVTGWRPFKHEASGLTCETPLELTRIKKFEEPGQEYWSASGPEFGIGFISMTLPAEATANKSDHEILEAGAKALARGKPLDSQSFVTANGTEFLEYHSRDGDARRIARVAWHKGHILEFTGDYRGMNSTADIEKYFASIQLAK